MCCSGGDDAAASRLNFPYAASCPAWRHIQLVYTAQDLTGLLSHHPRSAQRVPGTTEIAKKGTLRVDLQALTVGVALLAMHRWLVRRQARPACLLSAVLSPRVVHDHVVCSPHHTQNGTECHTIRQMAEESAASLRRASLKPPPVKSSLKCCQLMTDSGVVRCLQSGMRSAVASGPGGAPTLDSNRKLAVINGMGDHSRAQGNSSAVKEAIGACRL